MAELTGYDALGGVVGDTFEGQEIIRVFSDGVYVWNSSVLVNSNTINDNAGPSAPSAKPAFYIWCEENGALAANAHEWSYGNGATGNDIGIPIMLAAELTHMSFNADVFGTSVQIRAKRATTPGTGSIVADPIFSTNNSVYALPTPVLFNPGDTLVVQTGALVGSTTDARPCFRFQEV